MWFRARIDKHFSGSLSDSDAIQQPDPPPSTVESAPLARSIRLEMVHIHYFRGFREMAHPIHMGDSLVVVDGRNSSGKTSLAEALEWLLTGSLSRRERRDSGNARELEQCIRNQFRPDDVDTWVSAKFILESQDDFEEIVLRRVLKEDYGTTSTATCTSVLFIDDKELTLEEEGRVIDDLFAGVEPLLMQHTLRDFVESDPGRRRQYFERLLRLDELTNLISKAVIGDARLTDFPSLTGSIALQTWNRLGSTVETNPSKRTHNQVLRKAEDNVLETVTNALSSIALNEFSVVLSGLRRNEEFKVALAGEQRRVRQKSFPILAQLRPQRQLSDDAPERSYSADVDTIGKSVLEAWRAYEPTQRAAQSIGSDSLAISQAFKILAGAGMIRHNVATQVCPICAYEGAETLTTQRITTIEGWNPIQEAERSARRTLQQAMGLLVDVAKKAVREHDELLPVLPSESEWESAMKEAGSDLQQVVGDLRTVREEDIHLASTIANARKLLDNDIPYPTTSDQCEGFIDRCREIVDGLTGVTIAARRYRDAFRAVEAAVGAEASVDPQYRLRDAWISCFESTAAISTDLQWEQAKHQAQSDLQGIRESLIAYRQQFLESRRTSFNDGIQSVWAALRNERYSSFSKLHIPQPRGRGFPIEIEVKALLDDNQDQVEVDALRVFSESQVNALGIAAFVTRAKLLGHRMLIFDDPVQSMDEEHFKTFARDVISHVLNEGFQVIILTHNGTFARDVSHYHYDRPDYVTMSVRRSRRQGCTVEEGNRRVPERLTLSERKVDEGDLPDAWRYIRLAIERLYTITYLKYGSPDFTAESWQHQTAEHMWNNGAGEVIRSKMPNAESRLKEILDMTVAGGHDTPPRGETDLRSSIQYLRQLPNELNLGG